MNRAESIASIVRTAADYHSAPDADRVNAWISQFPAAVQEPLLAEVAAILSRYYFGKTRIETFLRKTIINPTLTGGQPERFWRGCGVLNIQERSQSQRELLEIFDGLLYDELGFSLADCAANRGQYVYLDDAVFSGARLGSDIRTWLRNEATPQIVRVDVVASVVYRSGEWNARAKLIKGASEETGKQIQTVMHADETLESRLSYRTNADVLWPAVLPDDANVAAYAQYLEGAGRPAEFRVGYSTGSMRVFSSHQARSLLEQEFLKAGAYIRTICSNLHEEHRPLGYSRLKTLGFGAMLVTFRNCPNSCPLAFWVADPWIPLFPRRINAVVGAGDSIGDVWQFEDVWP